MFSSQNLIKNTKFLTSNFDGHLMLQDILALSLGNSTKELFAERKNKLGVSLFSEVTNRTCQEAGVPLLYCSCNNGREKIQHDDPVILAIANGVLEDINQYLRLVATYILVLGLIHTFFFFSDLDFCQPLTLDSVQNVRSDRAD